MRIEDESYTGKKGYGNYNTHKTSEGYKYVTGAYVSPNGVVRVYAEPKDEKRKFSLISLTFSTDGRVYYRSIKGNKSISDKALSTRANQFVKQILNEI